MEHNKLLWENDESLEIKQSFHEKSRVLPLKISFLTSENYNNYRIFNCALKKINIATEFIQIVCILTWQTIRTNSE